MTPPALTMCTSCRGDADQCRCPASTRNHVPLDVFRDWRRARAIDPTTPTPVGTNGMGDQLWCLECGHRADWCACEQPDHVTPAVFGAARARALTVLSRSPRTGVDA